MGKRWSLLVLLLLVLFAVSLQCCQSWEHQSSEVAGDEGVTEDDDDLEDLEEGFVVAAGGAAEGDRHFDAMIRVANVNDQDIERVIESFDYVLLLGYAPWDTHSQALLPEFAAAAVELSRQGNPTVMAKLDAVNNPVAASLYKIRGFPTLIFFNYGVREEYSRGFSREDIVLWVRKKTGFAVTTITNIDEAEYFFRKNVTAAVGYFDKLEGPEHDAFLEAAEEEADTEFVLTTVPEVAQMLISPPLVAVRKQEPEYLSVFDGGFNAEEIAAFVELNKHSLLTVLNTKNANTVYSSPLNLHIMLFAESKDYEGVKSFYMEAGKQFKGKAMFLVIDLEDEEFSKSMLGVFGLDTRKPVVAALNNKDGSRYLLESDLTYETLKEFAADLCAGKLPMYYKSEPVPTENDGLVKMVVGKTVDEIVMDEAKDVFLFVYAPWCLTCEKIGRVFEKLAKHVQEIPSLVMAKYNAQENEHPLLMYVSNYPSLFLYPAGKKSNPPILAKSETSWKKLLVFLNENVAIPYPVSKDDTKVQNSNVQAETSEVEIATEQVNEISDPLSFEDLVGTGLERQERVDLDAQASQLKDEL